MEPFKNELSFEKAKLAADSLARVSPAFLKKEFLGNLNTTLPSLELKQRVNLLTDRLNAALPVPPPIQFEALVAAILDGETAGRDLRGFILWPFTELVARNGLDHFEDATSALREMTSRFSAEFAIRPFLRHHPERTLALLHDWCTHPDEHVRRLVSEGSRPLLPWGERLPELLAKPEKGLSLLEKLRADSSEYVRLSVSNHLNDLSKTHPGLIVETLRKWKGHDTGSVEFDKLSRHACRTLLKQGHPGALSLHGYGDPDSFEIVSFSLPETEISLGGHLPFTLAIRNVSKRPQKLLFDYAIHHRKANGGLSPKVFKGRIREMAPGETAQIEGNHSFRPVTTRRYYSGIHRFEPRINGVAHPWLAFSLDTGYEEK